MSKFISDERGTISKKSVLKGGTALGSIVFLADLASGHYPNTASHNNMVSTETTDRGEIHGVHNHSITHYNGC